MDALARATLQRRQPSSSVPCGARTACRDTTRRSSAARRLCEAVSAAVMQPHVRPFSRDVRLVQLSAFVEAVLHECDPLGLSAAAWPRVPVAWHEKHSGPDPKP